MFYTPCIWTCTNLKFVFIIQTHCTLNVFFSTFCRLREDLSLISQPSECEWLIKMEYMSYPQLNLRCPSAVFPVNHYSKKNVIQCIVLHIDFTSLINAIFCYMNIVILKISNYNGMSLLVMLNRILEFGQLEYLHIRDVMFYLQWNH